MEELNEKIDWKNFIIALGLSVISISNYKEYTNLKRLYSVVNSPSNSPSGLDKELIDAVRRNVLLDIESSDLFNRFNKKFVLDSIKNMSFRIVDTIDFAGKLSSAACYIDISSLKKPLKNIFLDVPKGDNFIIIERKTMNDPEVVSIITHEIYHYLDHLLGKKYSYSEEVRLDTVIDKRIKDKKWGMNKIALLIFGKTFEQCVKLDSKSVEVFGDLYDESIQNYDYYTSSSELFARYKTVKYEMVRLGIIKDMNEKLTIEKVSTLLIEHLDTDRRRLIIFFYLDMNKLDKIDNLL